MTNNGQYQTDPYPLPEMPESAPMPAPTTFARWLILAFAGFILLTLIVFALAIIGGLSDSVGVASFFNILRDAFVVVLALQGVLICLALIVLIVQLSALINLLNSEVQPMIDEAREALATARGTTEFVTQNVASPVIRATSGVVATATFLREVTSFGRLFRNSRTTHHE
jgi:hypothetical protein